MEATYTMAGAVLGISKLFGQNRSLSSIKKIDFEKQKNFVVVVNKRRFSKQETFCLGIGFLVNKKKVVIMNILVTYLITIVSILLQSVLPNKKRTLYRCLRSN